MKKDYSNFRDPEFAECYDNWLEYQIERCTAIDKLLKELDEVPEQLDLFIGEIKL